MNKMLKTEAGLSGLKVMSGGVEIKSDFVFKPRRKKAIRKTLGVGVNDAPYRVGYKRDDGKMVRCKLFARWSMMMARAYSLKFHNYRPTYVGCSVDKRWHSFMKFREWLEQQNWVGKELDKDLIQFGNKIYSPETCVLIPQSVNNLLTDSAKSRGDYPIGVSLHRNGKFIAQITENSKLTYLGCFNTIEAASKAYKEAKIKIVDKLIFELADEDPRLIPALRRIVFDMKADL